MWPELRPPHPVSQEGSGVQNKYNWPEAGLLEEANWSPQAHCVGGVGVGGRGNTFPRGSVFSQIYSTQSLMPDLSQKLSGQTTEGLPGDAGGDKTGSKLSPLPPAVLSPVGHIPGVLRRQPRVHQGPLPGPGWEVGGGESTE